MGGHPFFYERISIAEDPEKDKGKLLALFTKSNVSKKLYVVVSILEEVSWNGWQWCASFPPSLDEEKPGSTTRIPDTTIGITERR